MVVKSEPLSTFHDGMRVAAKNEDSKHLRAQWTDSSTSSRDRRFGRKAERVSTGSAFGTRVRQSCAAGRCFADPDPAKPEPGRRANEF